MKFSSISCIVITLVALTGSAAALPNPRGGAGFGGVSGGNLRRDLESDDLVARQNDASQHIPRHPAYPHGTGTHRNRRVYRLVHHQHHKSKNLKFLFGRTTDGY